MPIICSQIGKILIPRIYLGGEGKKSQYSVTKIKINKWIDR